MRNKKLYLVCASIFPFMICTGIVYSIMALFMASLGLNKSQIGLLFTFGALAGAISSPLWGALSDRFGRKRVLILSMSVFAAVFLGYSLAKSYTHLLYIQVGEGLAWSSMGASAMALIADMVTEQHRGKAMGIYNMTWNMGWIVGPTLGGFMSDSVGFPITFLLCTGLTITGLVLALIFIPSVTVKEGL